jgi:serralysin
MTAIATYGITGDPNLDGVLSGKKWGVSTLSFSFPTKGSFYGTNYGSGENVKGFEAFTSLQSNAVRDILKLYASVSKLSFVEKTESATVHAELRFAETDAASTAWGYYPSTSAVGGDSWFNNSKNYYDAPVRGNYAWLTMLHEIGHTMGLKHPHEVRGAFNALPADRDSLEYTVMSYRSYIGASTGTGYTNSNSSYPQTLMMLDIAAIQKLYGANFATNAGDTVYTWNPTTGAMSINGAAQGNPLGNKIFMTIWDGGGNDTYSFANYSSGVTVDLAPGAWTTTSATQLANLGSGKVAIGNIANALQYQGNAASLIENVIGTTGADKISGNAAANKLTGGGGNDVLDGRAGADTAIYSGASTSYSWTHNSDNSWTIIDLRSTSPNGIDTLRNIETMRFTDGVVQLGDASSAIVEETPVARTTTTATSDSYSTKMNTKLVVKSGKGVLRNDSDSDSDDLTATLVSAPSKGKLVLRSDGSFSYTPTKDFAGTVKFKYVASDGDDQSNVTKVYITVGAAKINAQGGDVDHDVTEDQIPGAKADGWLFNDDKHSSWSLPDMPFQSGMLDGLNSILANLGHLTAGFDAQSDGNLALPDFSKLFSSDHFWF